MKKLISLVLCALFFLGSTPVFAEDDSLSLKCPSALLMEFSTGQILYEKNSHEKLPMASVTKIMTMLLAMEAVQNGKITYDDMITGSAYAKSMGGSTIFLDEGEQLSVRDILKGIAVSSGNDAAVAMGEHLAGSAEGFVQMMNERAQQLGMHDTHFVNCNGLDADGHYVCRQRNQHGNDEQAQPIIGTAGLQVGNEVFPESFNIEYLFDFHGLVYLLRISLMSSLCW